MLLDEVKNIINEMQKKDTLDNLVDKIESRLESIGLFKIKFRRNGNC